MEPRNLLHVAALQPGSFGARTGLRVGDTVVAMNSSLVENAEDLRKVFEVQRAQPSANVTLTLERPGAAQPTQLTLTNYDRSMFDALQRGIEIRIPAEVGDLIPNYPAEKAGLKVGDRITKVDSQPVSSLNDISGIISKKLGKPVRLEYVRGQETKTVSLTPRPGLEDPSEGQIGMLAGADCMKETREANPLKAAAMAPGETIERLGVILRLNVNFFSKATFAQVRENVGGPIAIAALTVRSAKRGISELLNFFILLNLLLLIFNVLPLPVLDGGFILLAVIEAIIRRPVPPKILTPIYTFFVFCFIGLFLLISVQDVINLFS